VIGIIWGVWHMPLSFVKNYYTHPDSKIIHTILICIFSGVIVLREKKFFFDQSFDVGMMKV
jgi:hypothetical protein